MKEGVFSFENKQGYIKPPDDYNPAIKYPLILFFHGSGGSAANNNFTSKDFSVFRRKAAACGYFVAVPEYGSECWFYDDAEKITLEMLDFLSEDPSVDTKKFFVMGCSMGGASALIFTVRHSRKVKAVCEIFGVSDITRFYNEGHYNNSISAAYGGTPDSHPDYYRSRSVVNQSWQKYKDIPFLIFHGDRDTIVPKWNSDILFEKMWKSGLEVEYKTIQGIGHENRIVCGFENYILDFFNRRK